MDPFEKHLYRIKKATIDKSGKKMNDLLRIYGENSTFKKAAEQVIKESEENKKTP